MKEKIETFIKENGLQFTEGRRNNDSVILSGYSLFLGITNIEFLVEIIDEMEAAVDYYDELARVFNYAKSHKYEKYWSTDEAKKTYKY